MIPDPRDYLGPPLVEIVALTRPAGQGSKRHVGNGRMVEQSKYVKPFRQAVTDAAKRAIGDGWVPLDGSLTAAYTFTLAPPKRLTRLEPSVPPDVDKLERAANDALSPIYRGRGAGRVVVWGGVWVDDSRVTRVAHKAKTYPGSDVPGALDEPGVTIWIWGPS